MRPEPTPPTDARKEADSAFDYASPSLQEPRGLRGLLRERPDGHLSGGQVLLVLAALALLAAFVAVIAYLFPLAG